MAFVMREQSYKRYMLILLMAIMAFNYVDRLALGIVLQNIKLDLSLTDTQLGFLSGIAFFLFYSLMGIPIARWADRGNRRFIIAVTTALWSVAVALCGTARSFTQLLLIRVGVAVGEAGCVPPAHSLIADFFPRVERPRAASIYHLGTPLSFVIGYFGAGWLNQLYGWRTTFELLGLPGVGLALLAGLTLREPREREFARAPVSAGPQGQSISSAPAPGLKQVALTLWHTVTFRHLLLAYSVGSFFGAGIGQWQAAFFIRSFGLSSGELGTWLAVVFGGSGLLGVYIGGQWATRYAARNERLQLRVMALAYSAFGIISGCVFLCANYHVAFALMAVASLGVGTAIGPLFAMIQTLVPDRMRALSIAIVFLSANLIGVGLGPLAAGVLSDAYKGWAGGESLRYALLTLSPGYLWCAWHMWHGSRSVDRDLQASGQDSAAGLGPAEYGLTSGE